MTHWRKGLVRRPGRGRQGTPSTRPGNRGAARARTLASVVVDEYDGLILLRSSPDAAPRPEGVAELARAVAGGDEYFTLVVGADGAGPELWARLGTVLDSLRAKGVTVVRLVLSGAGGRRGERPALAQRIADAWGIEVIAPDAGVLILPGGSLFAHTADGPHRGWWAFAPGAEPTPLGPRSPAPRWQPALARLPGRTAGGYVVEQVPAGILVRSAREPRAWAADLCYSVPVDDEHLAVLVGASRSGGDADIPAEELASLLTALPAVIRSAVRLAPCGPVDLLSVGQDIAEILGAEVEVWTGLPLVVGPETEPAIRPVLIGADAEPTWAPFAEGVACRPYGADGTDGPAAPRLVRWRSPLPGGAATDQGVIRLSDRWQVAVTRSGLVVGPHGEPPAVAGRPVAADQMAIEVDLRDAPADDVLFTALSRLLSELDSGVREFVTLHRIAPSSRSDDEGFRMLRLAIDHGVSLVEPRPAEAAPAPAPSTVRTVVTAHAARPREERAVRPPAAQPTAGTRPPVPAAGDPTPRARAESTGPAADGFAVPARVHLPDSLAVPRLTQDDAAQPGREDVSAPAPAGRPEGTATGHAPTPSTRPPSARLPSAEPPVSVAQSGTGTIPPASAPPPRGSGAKPLPPNLARIPMTPVTPREPTAPASSAPVTEPTIAPQPPAGSQSPGVPPIGAAPQVHSGPQPPDAPQFPGVPRSPGAPETGAAPHPPSGSQSPAGPQFPEVPQSAVTPPIGAAPNAPTPARPAGPSAQTAPTAPSADPANPAEPQGPVPPAETWPGVRPEQPQPLLRSMESAAGSPQVSPVTSPPAFGGARPAGAAEPSPAGPVGSTGSSAPPAVPAPDPARSTAGVRPGPVAAPLRRSTEAERADFRSLAQPRWERHSASVNRAMTRMPALRGGQVDAVRTDLVAVHVYLAGGLGELDERAPASPGQAGLPDSYIACLASGLSRLPSYRGVAVRGGLPADGDLRRFVPGTVLRGPAPVSALPIGVAAGLSAATGGYVIWSSTGRRVRPLLGSGSGAASDEVVFSPGTAFRVLGVRSEGNAPIVLLSEVRGRGSDTGDGSGALDDADRAALERLDEALRRHAPSAEGTSPAAWPARCTEPLGGAMG